MSFFEETRVIGSVVAVGNVAHDAVDAGDPLKIGGKATNMVPSVTGELTVASVLSGDRVNALFDQEGRQATAVYAKYYSFPELNIVYDNSPTTATSSIMTVSGFRQAELSYAINQTGSPTNILFEVETSADGTDYKKLTNWGLGTLIYTSAAVASSGTLREAYTFPIAAQKMRVKVSCGGTAAASIFTVSSTLVYLRD